MKLREAAVAAELLRCEDAGLIPASDLRSTPHNVYNLINSGKHSLHDCMFAVALHCAIDSDVHTKCN